MKNLSNSKETTIFERTFAKYRHGKQVEFEVYLEILIVAVYSGRHFIKR